MSPADGRPWPARRFRGQMSHGQHSLLPGKPVACYYGLLWLIYGLLLSVVACYVGLLGFPTWSPVLIRGSCDVGLIWDPHYRATKYFYKEFRP